MQVNSWCVYHYCSGTLRHVWICILKYIYIAVQETFQSSDHVGTNLGTGDPKITAGPVTVGLCQRISPSRDVRRERKIVKMPCGRVFRLCFCHCMYHIIWKLSISFSVSSLRLWAPWRQVPCPVYLCVPCFWAAPGIKLVLSKCLYHVGSQCDGAPRRGCGSDPGFWHPAKTGGIYAGPVGANSVRSLLQEQEKVFAKESESIPARDDLWVIVCARVCVHAHALWTRM